MKVAYFIGFFAIALSMSQTASALEMRTDPATGKNYFLFPKDVQKPVDFAWQIPDTFLKEDGTYGKFDLKKIAAEDEDYISKNIDAISDNAINLLVDTKKPHIIETLYEFKKNYKACISVAGYGMSQCGLDVNYDAKSNFAVATIDSKWTTDGVTILKLKQSADGLQVVASASEVVDILNNEILNIMDAKLSANATYNEKRDSLVQVYTLDSIKMLYEDQDSFEARIVFNADSSIPKDDFYVDNKMVFRIKARLSNSRLSLLKE